MEASTILTSLLQLGTLLHDAFTKTQSAKDPGGTDWDAFFTSDAFKDVEGTVNELAGRLADDSDVQAAITEIDQKQVSLLNGRALAQLSTDELVQYSALSRARLLLTTEALANAMDKDFLSWLAEDALPVLVQILPIVLPLLV
jgi:hypothetical protein